MCKYVRITSQLPPAAIQGAGIAKFAQLCFALNHPREPIYRQCLYVAIKQFFAALFYERYHTDCMRDGHDGKFQRVSESWRARARAGLLRAGEVLVASRPPSCDGGGVCMHARVTRILRKRDTYALSVEAENRY